MLEKTVAPSRLTVVTLGVRDLFEKIFDIEAMHFIPKPNPEPYQLALEYLKVDPSECLLIDDMERNLKPAQELGMQTILIGNGSASANGTQVIANIKELTAVLRAMNHG